MMQPILEDVANRLENDAKVAKVDTDKAPKLGHRYQVHSIQMRQYDRLYMLSKMVCLRPLDIPARIWSHKSNDLGKSPSNQEVARKILSFIKKFHHRYVSCIISIVEGLCFTLSLVDD